MEQEKNRLHSFRMPMIELILVIGIFAVISVFLVQMFMGTNRLQSKATDISKALIQAETVAEQIKNSASIGETAKVFGMTSYDNSAFNYCIYYDNDWKQTKDPSNNIVLVTSSIEKKENGRMVSAEIVAYACKDVKSTKDREALVELTAKKWVNGN
jgi:type II secretory pathway pseudopilin PulG